MIAKCLISLLLGLAVAWSPAGEVPTDRELARMIKVLRPLHKRLGPPHPGDWLASHPEPGQTFRAYLASDPVVATAERRTLYLQPIGSFTPGQRRIVDKVVEGMEAYLCLPVKTLPALPRSAIPDRARRTLGSTGEQQFLTTYIMYEVLKPRLPADGLACIALTAEDLWAGEAWNFVFGQASIQDRVGVWSLARLGYPDQGDQPFNLCLVRALGTAVHETCHMLSMRHCTAFECAMCGSNSLEEGDRHPFWLCPVCLAKLCHAVKADPVARYRRLEAFCRENGLAEEAAFYRLSLKRLEAKR